MASLQRPFRPVRAVGRLALAAALGLTLAGCSGGERGSRPASPTVTTVASVPKPAKPVPRSVVLKTKQRLVASKLQASDVGLGWAPMARKTSSSGPQHFCNRDLADLKPFARTDAVYQRRNGGGVVAQSMSAYPGRQAHRVIAEFRKLLDTCNGWSRADNGVSTTYTLSPIAFPPVGEDSVAARLNTAFSFKQRPVTITTDFVMLRVGNVVMYLGRTAPVGQQPSSAALASLAQIAAHRVTAA